MANGDLGSFAEESVNISADMLDAYIQGSLPPEQQAAFESYIMDKPELLEQAELGLLMQEGFRSQETVSVAPKTRAEPQWRLAAAAAIVSVGVGSMLGYTIGDDASDQRASANRLLVSQVVNLPITRSEISRQVDVAVSYDAAIVVLRIPLPNPESKPYKVTITNDAGQIDATATARPDGGGVLTLSVDGMSLAAGSYLIEVGGDAEPITLNVTRLP